MRGLTLRREMDARGRSLHRKVVMDFVFLALTVFLLALTFGLVRLCERV